MLKDQTFFKHNYVHICHLHLFHIEYQQIIHVCLSHVTPCLRLFFLPIINIDQTLRYIGILYACVYNENNLRHAKYIYSSHM